MLRAFLFATTCALLLDGALATLPPPATLGTWQSNGTLSVSCGGGTLGDPSETNLISLSENRVIRIVVVRGCKLLGDEWLTVLAGHLDSRVREIHLLNNMVDANRVVGLEPTNSSGSIQEVLKSVKVLNVTGNRGVWHFLATDTFAMFTGLQSLILADNDLVTLDEHVYRNFSAELKDLVLIGNRWECQKMEGFVSWYRMQQQGVRLLRQHETSCDYVEHRIIFGSTTFDLLVDSCPANCTCVLVQTMIKVDCRNRGFHTLPQHVPHTTGILHMENNRIRSLQPLTNGTNYLNLRFLYVDNNSISSINVLEGTDIFNGLNVLHISGNQLTQVPTHVLDRLLSTAYLEDVTLGRNPWNCECNTVAPFHGLLLKHVKRFKDVDQIRCSSTSVYQPNRTISKLSMLEICATGHLVHPLDILNVCLVLIIVTIGAKILYDYRSYRLTGHLPMGPWQYWQSGGKSDDAAIIVEHRLNSGAAKV